MEPHRETARAGVRGDLARGRDALCRAGGRLGDLAGPVAFSDTRGSAEAAQAYTGLPLSFESNDGQAASTVDFLARSGDSTLYLTDEGATLGRSGRMPALVGMEVVGPDRLPSSPQGLDPLPGHVHYLDGAEDWVTDVPTFGSVRYDEIYPGIDLVYHGQGGRLEYDFLVAPGAAVSDVAMRFSGIDGMTLQPNGDLRLETRAGNVVHQAPIAYQESPGGRLPVTSAYELDGAQVSFVVGDYDVSRELVIDPVFSYSTYLGGRTNDTAYAVAVDAAGNAYVGGRTDSVDFPLRNPFETRVREGFVTKLNPSGTALVFSTYFPGIVEAITVDAGGNAYVAGPAGLQFPVTPGAFQTSPQGGFDAFVTKINAQGSGLVFSTYLGGDWDDFSTGIAVDGAGNTYVTGWTKCPIPDGTAAASRRRTPSSRGSVGGTVRDEDERDRHRRRVLDVPGWGHDPEHHR